MFSIALHWSWYFEHIWRPTSIKTLVNTFSSSSRAVENVKCTVWGRDLVLRLCTVDQPPPALTAVMTLSRGAKTGQRTRLHSNATCFASHIVVSGHSCMTHTLWFKILIPPLAPPPTLPRPVDYRLLTPTAHVPLLQGPNPSGFNLHNPHTADHFWVLSVKESISDKVVWPKNIWLTFSFWHKRKRKKTLEKSQRLSIKSDENRIK